ARTGGDPGAVGRDRQLAVDRRVAARAVRLQLGDARAPFRGPEGDPIAAARRHQALAVGQEADGLDLTAGVEALEEVAVAIPQRRAVGAAGRQELAGRAPPHTLDRARVRQVGDARAAARVPDARAVVEPGGGDALAVGRE